MVPKMVLDNVAPVPRGASRVNSLRPRLVMSAECASGNWAIKAALAIQLYGACRLPSDRLMPKNIATTMVPTPRT